MFHFSGVAPIGAVARKRAWLPSSDSVIRGFISKALDGFKAVHSAVLQYVIKQMFPTGIG